MKKDGKNIYAVKAEPSTNGYFTLKLWVLGAGTRVRNIAFSDCEKFAAQIGEALANGNLTIKFSDVETFNATEKILNDLRRILTRGCARLAPSGSLHKQRSFAQKNESASQIHSPLEFISYAVKASGGNDADTVRDCNAIQTEASATARNLSPSRHISKARKNSSHSEQCSPSVADISADVNFNQPQERKRKNDVELEDTAHTPLALDISKVVGNELRKAIAPLLVELDSIAALLNECLDKLDEDLPEGWESCTVEFKPKARMSVAPATTAKRRDGAKPASQNPLRVQTKYGRVSAVVGRRRVK